MKNVKILCLLLLITNSVLAQTDSTELVFYSNGNIRWEINLKPDGLTEYIEYHKSGGIKDSMNYQYGVLFGERKKYFKDGNVKLVINYGTSPTEGTATISKFRKDKSLKITGGVFRGKAFGMHKRYNSKGNTIFYSDMNKGKTVRVPNKYRNLIHIKKTNDLSLIVAKKATLYNSEEAVKIKQGAMVSLKFKDDDQLYRHNQIEGFGMDSIYLSKFNYDISENKKTLDYDSTYSVNFDQITSMHFARNNSDMAEFAAFTIYIASIIWFTEALILFPILEGSFALLAEPVVLAFIGLSPPLYIWSRYLYKKLVPVEYSTAEWEFKVE